MLGPARWGSLEALWSGYVITADGAGNFKLPLLFLCMLLPLVFHGGGKISLDHLLLKISGRDSGITDRLWSVRGLPGEDPVALGAQGAFLTRSQGVWEYEQIAQLLLRGDLAGREVIQ